jgi:hypothetical protein
LLEGDPTGLAAAERVPPLRWLLWGGHATRNVSMRFEGRRWVLRCHEGPQSASERCPFLESWKGIFLVLFDIISFFMLLFFLLPRPVLESKN